MLHVSFVRHGESVSNVEGRWQGQGDSPLSRDGVRQAHALAERFRPDPFDLVVSSDLSRALETARALGEDVVLEPRFREVDVGAWEGLTYDEVHDEFRDEIVALGQGRLDVAIGGGESWLDVHERASAAFLELLERARREERRHVAVVCHGGVFRALFADVLGIRERHPSPLGRVSNTGVSTFCIDGDAIALERWNDTSHLATLGPWATARRHKGDAVVSLMAHDGAVDRSEPPPGGRLRAGGPTLAFERLASAYNALDAVYAAREPVYRNAAAIVATRSRVAVEDEPIGGAPLEPAMHALAERHRGGHVGVVVDAEAVSGLAMEILRPGRAAVATPRHGSVSHVVVTSLGPAIAHYGV